MVWVGLVRLLASSGGRLCNGTVSVRLSVCMSVPLIDSSSDVEVVCCCRRRVPAVDRYLLPTAERSSGQRHAVIRGGSTQTELVLVFIRLRLWLVSIQRRGCPLWWGQVSGGGRG